MDAGTALTRHAKALKARRDDYASQMARGSPADFTKYRELVARIDEIDRVLVEVESLYQKLFSSKDEET